MKKTIAKIMAAAMVLSAVPAVALPTMTAEAAKAVTISNVPVSTRELGNGGNTEVIIEGDTTVATSDLDLGVYWNDDTKQDTTTKLSSFTASINDNGELCLVASDSISSDIASRVNTGKNLIDVYANDSFKAVTLNGNAVTRDDNTTVTYTASDEWYLGTFMIGGTKDALSGTIKADIYDEAGLLNSGDVYGSINLSSGEATILAGNGKLKDNDSLRGQTLNLNTIEYKGATYEVTKFGGQALKEAHMKKFVAENTKKLGKGSLRKCKQVKKVDISDSNKVRKIHSKAFYGDKNLKTITIDGRKLNTVGSQAFSGVKKNCVIKIKAKKTKYESDVKLIKKSGAKNVKYTRVAP